MSAQQRQPWSFHNVSVRAVPGSQSPCRFAGNNSVQIAKTNELNAPDCLPAY